MTAMTAAGMAKPSLVLVAAQAWPMTAPAIRNPDGGAEWARLARHRAAGMTEAHLYHLGLVGPAGLATLRTLAGG